MRYILNYDENQWECVEDSEELLVPILKRITDGPTWLNVIAEEAHEDRFGNIVWENVATQGYSFERILDKPCSHDWEVTEKKDATCTAEGSKEYTCSVCGQTKSEAIEKIAHNIVTVVDSQPTCGATQTVTVKLQGSTVQAKKITGISKKLTLKVKKKATLKPVVTPISNQNKITYKSSKTKVATVSKKGVITAKKAGKTTITVTCGKVKVKCTVTVKK